MSSKNLPWWSPHRPWGARFSRTDLIVVLVGVFVTLSAAQWSPDLAVLTPFVLGHFFLFCNVFRVGELQELAWSGLFLANVTVCLLTGSFSWWAVLPLQSIATIVVIARTLKHPDYHGIACQQINPLGYRLESRLPRRSLVRTMLAWFRVPSPAIDLLLGRPRTEGDGGRSSASVDEVRESSSDLPQA